MKNRVVRKKTIILVVAIIIIIVIALFFLTPEKKEPPKGNGGITVVDGPAPSPVLNENNDNQGNEEVDTAINTN